MSKYDPLGFYLKAQPSAYVPMTFREIEAIIGVPLPPVAKSARAWWSNNSSNNVMTKVWTSAGFRSEQVDMAGEKLVFRRDGPPKPPTSQGSLPAPPTPPASPAHQSARPHPLFGCLKGATSIAAGHDLTAPADAGWSEASR